MIRAIPTQPRIDATSVLVLTGAPPARVVSWSSTSGTVTPLATRTDGSGRAFAVFTPASEGAVTIEVEYGA